MVKIPNKELKKRTRGIKLFPDKVSLPGIVPALFYGWDGESSKVSKHYIKKVAEVPAGSFGNRIAAKRYQ